MTMPTLYLSEQGSVLHKRGDTLVVTKEGVQLLEVECHRVDTVLIFGNVQFSTQAVVEMLEHNIEFALLSMDGKLRGQLTPPLPKNILLRVAQYERIQEENFVIQQAREVVRVKIENSLEVLKQADWHNPLSDYSSARRGLEESMGKIETVERLEELNGLEGAVARHYFQAFPILLKAEGIQFQGRVRRPPTDPVNAILSFGYTLLGSRIQSLLDASGFDPYLGFMHQVDYGRPSLALDLLEVFRAPVVDRATIRLFNLKILKAGDFTEEPDKGLRLNRESLKKFFTEWEKTLTKMDFHGILKRQIDSLAAMFKGEREYPDYYRFRAE